MLQGVAYIGTVGTHFLTLQKPAVRQLTVA